jgi:hypothetical protein
VSTELGTKVVNQLKDVPDKDSRNNLTLCTSIIVTSLSCARNCHICSYMVLAS